MISLSPFSLFKRQTSPACAPEGMRIYAIGDIHGCHNELRTLLSRICQDAQSAEGECRIIYLGDYVDRGPDSKAVVETVLCPPEGFNADYILGNHDQTLLDFLEDAEIFKTWQSFGGRETLMSYGVRPPLFERAEAFRTARDEFHDALPQMHLDFFKSLRLSVSYGDYFFTHAGVRPGIALDKQMAEDLLWIREDFLGSNSRFGKIIVHGHTPAPEPERRINRIGVDTGAYMTGRLTAAVLEGTQSRFLQS